jgi:hypothetical protein
MKRIRWSALAAALAVCAATAGYAGYKTDDKAPKPEVIGAWTGTWSITSGEHAGAAMRLDCKVLEKKGSKWEAVFEGECGRPYKYTVKMDGRQSGKAVLFKGTADLGEKDGGIFDWVGRATEKEFVGFYTSGAYTGSFKLARAATSGAPPALK